MRGGGERRGGGGERRGRPRRFGRQSRKVCSFCVDKVDKINCRDIGRLRNYLTDRATIQARRKTGTCSKHQRRLSTAIKRARFLALLPSTSEHIRVAMQYGLRDVPTR
jgi:small subunit ribosomal protein S18